MTPRYERFQSIRRSTMKDGIGFRKLLAKFVDDSLTQNLINYTNVIFDEPKILVSSFNKIVSIYSNERIKLLSLRVYFSTSDGNELYILIILHSTK